MSPKWNTWTSSLQFFSSIFMLIPSDLKVLLFFFFRIFTSFYEANKRGLNISTLHWSEVDFEREREKKKTIWKEKHRVKIHFECKENLHLLLTIHWFGAYCLPSKPPPSRQFIESKIIENFRFDVPSHLLGDFFCQFT